MAATSVFRLAGIVPVDARLLTTAGVNSAEMAAAFSAETALLTLVAACCTDAGTCPVAVILDRPLVTAAATVDELTDAAVTETAAGAVGVTSGSFTLSRPLNV